MVKNWKALPAEIAPDLRVFSTQDLEVLWMKRTAIEN